MPLKVWSDYQPLIRYREESTALLNGQGGMQVRRDPAVKKAVYAIDIIRQACIQPQFQPSDKLC